MAIINMVYLAKEESWWKPWANTVVYYPLDTDFNDYSWNWKNLTWRNWAVIWTLNWVRCLDLTATNSSLYGVVSNLPQWNQDRTNMFYVQWRAFGTYVVYHYWTSWNYHQEDTVWTNDAFSSKCISWSSYWYGVDSPSNYGQINQRMHIAITTSGSSDQKMYINWQYVANWNETGLNTQWVNLWLWGLYNWNYPLNWYLSKFIIEDRVWTDQEISDYYNQTKWDYWL